MNFAFRRNRQRRLARRPPPEMTRPHCLKLHKKKEKSVGVNKNEQKNTIYHLLLENRSSIRTHRNRLLLLTKLLTHKHSINNDFLPSSKFSLWSDAIESTCNAQVQLRNVERLRRQKKAPRKQPIRTQNHASNRCTRHQSPTLGYNRGHSATGYMHLKNKRLCLLTGLKSDDCLHFTLLNQEKHVSLVHNTKRNDQEKCNNKQELRMAEQRVPVALTCLYYKRLKLVAVCGYWPSHRTHYSGKSWKQVRAVLQDLVILRQIHVLNRLLYGIN